MLRSIVLVGMARQLLSDPRMIDEGFGEEESEEVDRLEDSWHSWREHVEALIGEVKAEQLARRLIDRRYFHGRSVLFRETAKPWAELGAQIDRLDWMRQHVPKREGAQVGTDQRPEPAGEPGLLGFRASERMRELVDDGRIAAFKTLGDHDRARQLVERRLRGPAALDDGDGASTDNPTLADSAPAWSDPNGSDPA
jgi:hypothetical protein